MFLFTNCSSDSDIEPAPNIDSVATPAETMYFPPIGIDTWDKKSIAALNWNQTAVQPLHCQTATMNCGKK